MSNVIYVLRAFNRSDDKLSGEWPIHGLAGAELQRMFGIPHEMCDSYPVPSEHVEALQEATGHVFNSERYEYFVEADAVEPPEHP